MSYMDEMFNIMGMEAALQEIAEHKPSRRLDLSKRKYEVNDDEVRDFLFRISIHDLCMLVDTLIMKNDIEERELQSKIELVIDVAGWGMAHKHLSHKQRWLLGTFCVFWMKEQA